VVVVRAPDEPRGADLAVFAEAAGVGCQLDPRLVGESDISERSGRRLRRLAAGVWLQGEVLERQVAWWRALGVNWIDTAAQ
jgi:hypothetical protein